MPIHTHKYIRSIELQWIPKAYSIEESKIKVAQVKLNVHAVNVWYINSCITNDGLCTAEYTHKKHLDECSIHSLPE